MTDRAKSNATKSAKRIQSGITSVPILGFDYGAVLQVAREAYNRSVSTNGNKEHDLRVGVVFSAIAFEGFINQTAAFYKHLSNFGEIPEKMKAIGQTLTDLEETHSPIRTKLQVLHWIMFGKTCEMGKPPLQDLDHMIKLRDHIVHSRAEAGHVPDKIFVKFFESHGLCVKRKPNHHIGLIGRFDAPKTIKWSYDTVVKSIQLLAGDLQLSLGTHLNCIE